MDIFHGENSPVSQTDKSGGRQSGRLKKPELLSPAGNLEKLKFAVLYGADAVYCALDRFGMRAAADNFTAEELVEGIKYAHSHGVKVYCTLNTMPHEEEFEALREYLKSLKNIGADAYIVADTGVIQTIKEIIPDAVLHLSTQASTVNSAACRFWYENGIKRIVLARELSLEQIKRIRSNTPDGLELEVFVHGSMCVSYSGRCLLSNYFVSRNANDGRCAQPCRWKYFVSEESRDGDRVAIEQDKEGTYLFSSKDLCMLGHIPELVDSGVDSFKIEGRVKSAYYTAAVTNAYRIALEEYFNNPKEYTQDSRLLNEVVSVSHRELSTGFFFTSPQDEAQICQENKYIKDRAFIATVERYDEKTGLAYCIQRNKINVGDSVELLAPGKTGEKTSIKRLFDSEFAPIESTPHPKMEFYADLGMAAEAGYIIRGTDNC